MWGNCLRGPDTPHHVCEHEEHHHLRAAEENNGGGGLSATAAAVMDDDAKNPPKANTMRTLEDKTFSFSTNADFDLGSLINVNYNAVQDELQLDEDPQPFNFIWVACSDRGTVVKLDTLSHKILGEYQTAPTVNGQTLGNLGKPSCTTVDKDGSVWVANMENLGPNKYGTIVHIGLVENNQCEDRNGNGIIETSTGQGDIKNWTDGSGTRNVTTADDECIIHYTEVNSKATRQISVDSENNVWVSGSGLKNFDKVKGGGWSMPDSGSIMQSYPAVKGNYGGHGSLIDPKGFLWSVGNLLRWDTSKPLTGDKGVLTGKDMGPIKPGYNWAGLALGPADSTGLCIDSQGNVWVTYEGTVMKYSPEGKWIKSYTHGGGSALGCVVDKNDHVWVTQYASSLVGHLYNNGTLVGGKGIVKVGSSPRGVAVDGAGKIWVANRKDHTISVIDPAENNGIGNVTDTISLNYTNQKKNCFPGNIGDMTGSTNIGPPTTGTWAVKYDYGSVLDNWGSIQWNAELPDDSSLSVKVRNNEGDPWKPVENGQELSDMSGQYLYVQVFFQRGFIGGASPSLKDLSLTFLDPTPPPTTSSPTPTITPSPTPTVTPPPGRKAELWVGHHQFQSHMDNFDQAKIWVISSNPNHHSSLPVGTWNPVPKNMKGLDDYNGDRKFAKFYSIGAGEVLSRLPEEVASNLAGEINRQVDVSKALHLPKFVMEIDDPAAFKTRVDRANQIMNDNFSNTLLCYQVYPWMDWLNRGYGWVEFNSNGYISGLLSFLGQQDNEMPGGYLYGWEKPVPKVFFEQVFTDNNLVKKEIFPRPPGGEAELWFGYHSVFTSGEEDVWVDHAKLWVISSNPAHHEALDNVWNDLRQDRIPVGYKGDKNFAKFFTFGAGFTKPELKPELNYQDDVNINLSGAQVLASSGIDPVSLMTTIDTANKNMWECFNKTDLKRETAFPRDWNDWGWGWNEFNGNGYISGLLSFLKPSMVFEGEANPGGILPGWDKAVPSGFFESSCTSTLEAQLLIFDEHPTKFCNEYTDLIAELAAAQALVGNESEASQLQKLDLTAPPVKIEQSVSTPDPLF